MTVHKEDAATDVDPVQVRNSQKGNFHIQEPNEFSIDLEYKRIGRRIYAHVESLSRQRNRIQLGN